MNSLSSWTLQRIRTIHPSIRTFAGRLLEIYQISRSGKENQSPGFSVKPKQIFFLCYFPNSAWPNWVLFPADSSMFFLVNRKCSILVNTGSDWPFSAMCSDLQRNHEVFLALGLGKHVWACRLILFLIGCFSPRVLCTKCYKASDLMFVARKQ